MDDPAPLICPVCAAEIPSAGPSEFVRCDTCGFEHLVRDFGGGSALETVITCPVCGKHDRTASVVDILRLHSNSSGGDPDYRIGLDMHDPQTVFSLEQIQAAGIPPGDLPELLNRLEPPRAPRFRTRLDIKASPPRFTFGLLVMPALLGIPLACLLFTAGLPGPNSTSLDYGIFFLCLFLGLVAVFFLIDAALDLRRNEESKARAGMNERENWRDFYKKNEQWKKAIQRWNTLYYCGRDECVFLPNTSTAAPVARMEEYLFQP